MGDPAGEDPEDLDAGARSPESAEEGPGTDMERTLNKEQAGGADFFQLSICLRRRVMDEQSSGSKFNVL